MRRAAASPGNGPLGRRFVPVYTALAHGTRMLAALAIIKLISVYAGPEGLAQLGFFMSLASIVAVFAGGGIGNAVTKFVAEYQPNPVQVARFLGCALLYGGIFSLVVLGLSILFAGWLSEMVFADAAFWWLMPIFGIAQLVAFVGVMTTASVNGVGRQDLFAKITLVANIVAVVAAYVLISQFGIVGGALALSMVTASVGIVSLIVILRSGILRVLRPRYSPATFRQLLRFSLMMLSAATFFPITEILVRSQIVEALGLEVAGLWQGLFRMSGSYIGFFSVYLATAFMPRLSSTPDLLDARLLVLQQMLRIGAGFLICAIGIYMLREQAVLIVFSPAFMPLSDVIGWQLLGDLFRVLSYVIGFLLVAKAAARLYVLGEFLQFATYLATMTLTITAGGDLEAITRGYAISYGIYLAVMIALLFGFTGKRAA